MTYFEHDEALIIFFVSRTFGYFCKLITVKMKTTGWIFETITGNSLQMENNRLIRSLEQARLNKFEQHDSP